MKTLYFEMKNEYEKGEDRSLQRWLGFLFLVEKLRKPYKVRKWALWHYIGLKYIFLYFYGGFYIGEWVSFCLGVLSPKGINLLAPHTIL